MKAAFCECVIVALQKSKDCDNRTIFKLFMIMCVKGYRDFFYVYMHLLVFFNNNNVKCDYVFPSNFLNVFV